MRLRPQHRQAPSPAYEQKLIEQAGEMISEPKRVVRWRLAIGLASVPCGALGFYFWSGLGSAHGEKLLLVVILVVGGLFGLAAMLVVSAKSLWIER